MSRSLSGHVRRAAAVFRPLKRSSVPPSANDLITLQDSMLPMLRQEDRGGETARVAPTTPLARKNKSRFTQEWPMSYQRCISHGRVSARRGAEGGPREARTEPPQRATPDAPAEHDDALPMWPRVGGHAHCAPYSTLTSLPAAVRPGPRWPFPSEGPASSIGPRSSRKR